MTDQHPTDGPIKRLFENYEPPVPEGTWEKIQARRQRDDKPLVFWFTRPAGKMIAAALILLMLGAGTYYYVSHQNHHKNTPDQVRKNIDQNATGDHSSQTNSTGDNHSITSLKQEASTQKNPASENLLTDHPASSKIDDLQNTVPANKQTSAGITNRKKNRAKNDGRTSIHINQALTGDDSDAPGYTGNNKQAPANSSLRDEDAGEIEFSEKSLNSKLLNLSLIGSSKKERRSVSKPALSSLFIPCPEAEKNAAANKTYVEIYAGPDYAFRKLTDTGSSSYLQMRRQSSKTSFAYSAGIRYNRVFKNGISVRAGINYSQVSEKFNHEQGNIVHTIYIINPNGDTTGSYYSSSTRYLQSVNKYRSVDIPLAMGYEMGNGNLHLNINAGPVINIRSWQKGLVVDRDGKIVDISTGKEGASSAYGYKTNIGMGFMGSVSFYYKLNERLHLLAEPYFRYNFSTVSRPEETLQQRHHNAGLRLGLRLDL